MIGRIARAIKADFDAARNKKAARETSRYAALESLEDRLIKNADKKAIVSREEYQLLCESSGFVSASDTPMLSITICAYCGGDDFVNVDGGRCNGCGRSAKDGCPLVGLLDGIEIFVKRDYTHIR